MSDAVNSIVMTGRWMNGFERPDENWTSLPPGVFSPETSSRCSPGSPGGAVRLFVVAVVVSHWPNESRSAQDPVFHRRSGRRGAD